MAKPGQYERTPEVRAKIRAAHQGMKASEKTKLKLSMMRKGEGNAFYGRRHSEESKAKMRAAHLGKPIPKLQGLHHPLSSGGRKTVHGYVMVYTPEHPRCDEHGYVYEHWLIMEQVLGRPLQPNEVPHHKNSIRDDNRPENLELFESQSAHAKYHKEVANSVLRRRSRR